MKANTRNLLTWGALIVVALVVGGLLVNWINRQKWIGSGAATGDVLASGTNITEAGENEPQ